MRTPPRLAIVVVALAASCATNPDKQTLGDLHREKPDTEDVRVDEGLEAAMAAYQRYLASSRGEVRRRNFCD